MKNFLAIFMLVLGLGVGSIAAEIPADLTGTLIVLNKNSDNASFIDLASGLIVATLPTGEGPHELIVSDDGLVAVGTNYSGGNSLTVFDIENLKVERTIDLGAYPRPHGIQFLPGQAEVVVTSETKAELVFVNIQNGTTLGAVATSGRGSHMVALAKNGELAFTSNLESNNVSVINLVRGRMQAAFRVPGRPEAITVNRSATEIWVGSNEEGVVSVLNSATGKVTAQWSGFSWPYRILLSNDEQLAVIPDMNNNDLRFIDAVNKQEVGKIELGEVSPQGIIFHSNDQVLFLSLAGKDKVLVVDRQSREILGEYETGSAPDGIGYSPLVLK
jgi:DNA-binding beta-propeller fold protein YncE